MIGMKHCRIRWKMLLVDLTFTSVASSSFISFQKSPTPTSLSSKRLLKSYEVLSSFLVLPSSYLELDMVNSVVMITRRTIQNSHRLNVLKVAMSPRSPQLEAVSCLTVAYSTWYPLRTFLSFAAATTTDHWSSRYCLCSTVI